jgi:hypothetical protein
LESMLYRDKTARSEWREAQRVFDATSAIGGSRER